MSKVYLSVCICVRVWFGRARRYSHHIPAVHIHTRYNTIIIPKCFSNACAALTHSIIICICISTTTTTTTMWQPNRKCCLLLSIADAANGFVRMPVVNRSGRSSSFRPFRPSVRPHYSIIGTCRESNVYKHRACCPKCTQAKRFHHENADDCAIARQKNRMDSFMVCTLLV